MVLLGKEYDDMENSYELLQEGEYKIYVFNIQLETSKNGFQNLNFEFKFKEHKQHAWRRLFLQGKDDSKTKTCLGMLSGFLKNCGLSDDERHSLDSEDFTKMYNMLEGKALIADISHNHYLDAAGNKKTNYDIEILGRSDDQEDDVPF